MLVAVFAGFRAQLLPRRSSPGALPSLAIHVHAVWCFPAGLAAHCANIFDGSGSGSIFIADLELQASSWRARC